MSRANNPDNRRIRAELTNAAVEGIRKFLDTTRGAELLGANANAFHVGTNCIQVVTSKGNFEAIFMDRPN